MARPSLLTLPVGAYLLYMYLLRSVACVLGLCKPDIVGHRLRCSPLMTHERCGVGTIDFSLRIATTLFPTPFLRQGVGRCVCISSQKLSRLGKHPSRPTPLLVIPASKGRAAALPPSLALKEIRNQPPTHRGLTDARFSPVAHLFFALAGHKGFIAVSRRLASSLSAPPECDCAVAFYRTFPFYAPLPQSLPSPSIGGHRLRKLPLMTPDRLRWQVRRLTLPLALSPLPMFRKLHVVAGVAPCIAKLLRPKCRCFYPDTSIARCSIAVPGASACRSDLPPPLAFPTRQCRSATLRTPMCAVATPAIPFHPPIEEYAANIPNPRLR